MRPSQRLVIAFLLWGGIGAVAESVPAMAMIWPWLGVLLVVLGFIDAVRLARTAVPEVTRVLPQRLAQSTPHEIRITLRHAGSRSLRVTVLDRVPADAETVGLPWFAIVPPGQKLTLDYSLTRSEEHTSELQSRP